MTPFDLPRDIKDQSIYDNAVEHLRKAGVILPTFAELADPTRIPNDIIAAVQGLEPDAPRSGNLFRVHWHNDEARTGLVDIPAHLVLTKEVTGVDAPIIVALGDRFPMIAAHKVLPAYACLVVSLISGQFDPSRHRAIWPSTGNYCRGGVAISRILGCRGVAVLPAGMSRERFDWLEGWVTSPEDIIRTPGSESNVKEIYDKCSELAADPDNVILNQFSEFANYLAHYRVTGTALHKIFTHLQNENPSWAMAAFVAGTGSAGTLAAGDFLKETHGARIVAMEPIECPTMLSNGYGEHNIQGVGDKHIPLIQNVMNSDIVAGVSDESCDRLSVLFGTKAGRQYLTERQGIDVNTVEDLGKLGLSGIANILAAIKTARLLNLSENEAIVTVATDSGALYDSERKQTEDGDFPHGFDQVAAGEVYAQHMLGLGTDDTLELTHQERQRIFNLGYYTWVEQQGISLDDFDQRRHQNFWKKLQDIVPVWDEMIIEFNRRTGVNKPS
jgi:cysteine synthase